MKSIYGLTYKELEEFLIYNNEKKYRAKQIFEWLYKKKATSFLEMTNLSNELINFLSGSFCVSNINVVKEVSGKDVTKFLFKLSDGELVEGVLMKHDYGNSLCVSSQVGCNMGCTFCESGRLKKVRNLSSEEMVEQILLVEKTLNIRVSHVVIMGIGEPFDNYDNVLKFIRIISDSNGIDIGIRHITVSTCGIIPKIKEFALENLQANLAISLHAPTDKIRNSIMKINKTYKINALIEEVKNYISKTNRRVTFEYVMLKDINDSEECAQLLSKLLKGINAYVNLIPYNETSNLDFFASKNADILKFYDILKKNNINVTIRREMGSNIEAACGQLRSNHKEEIL